MSQISPRIQLRYGPINLPVKIVLSPLLLDAAGTFITADSASGSSTITVKNNSGISINNILLIGEPTSEGSEIIKTHASTAPSGSTVTLATTTSFPHSASTIVYVLRFDQVEISNALTVTGTKTVLTTTSLASDSDTTDYYDTTSTSGYYFARFKNSITATFSPYSAAAPYSGWTMLSARSIIDSSLQQINKKTSEVLSDEFAFHELDNYQYEIIRERKRWSFMQSLNTVLGDTATGSWKVAVPTDLDDQNTNKSIWNFRIGHESDMTWVDKEKWDEITQGVANTTLSVSIIVGAATITLTDSSDFDDSGVVTIGANTYTYTANARTTGILTLSVVSTTTNTAGADVFSGASFGNPLYWTTYGGYIYHYPGISSSYNQRNYYLDYYKKVTQITSDADLLVIPDPTCAQYYLQWKFLRRLNGGEETAASKAAFSLYDDRRKKLIQKDVLGNSFQLKPRINSLQENIMTDDKQVRLGAFPTA